MRASNEFVSGNWSEAYEIPLSSMGTGCASTSPTNVNNISEEFSGSGMRELPNVTTPGQPSSCHIPASSNLNRGRKNLMEEELEDVMMEGRCYLACIADEDYMVTELL